MCENLTYRNQDEDPFLTQIMQDQDLDQGGDPLQDPGSSAPDVTTLVGFIHA